MILMDFEVFKFDFMMVAYDIENKEKIVIVNDREKLEDFYHKYKGQLLLGYNIRGYDKYIMQGILCGFDPYDISQFIIEKGRKGHEYSRMFNKFPLCFYDVKTLPVGLKVLEGFLGENIQESSVPFDIQRKLTPEEINEVLSYCEHDVQMTGEVLNNKQSMKDFNAQWGLVTMFDLPLSDMGKTKAQLGAKILGAVKPNKPRGDDRDFVIADTIVLNKYKFVMDWFLDMQKKANQIKDLDEALTWMYKQKLEVQIAGMDCVFAWGGLHGVRSKVQEEGYFYDLDCGSFYPAIMIEYDLLSRNVHNPKKFVEIRDKRLKYKHEGDIRAESLKLVINSVYGASKDQYNPLFDARQANSVCVSGQLLLLSLIELLEPYCDIYAANTDGITIKLRATNDKEARDQFSVVKRICRRWERLTRMTLEDHEYRKLVARDVNNYIMVDVDGDLKTKGGVVKKLHDLDYDLPIINRAVVNYLIYGISPEETVNNCNDLRDFQKIYKVSGKYEYAKHNGKELPEKVFRVFASLNQFDTTLYKGKWKGDRGVIDEKFAACPDHCFIDNGYVKGKPLPNILDTQWYIDEAKIRILQFLGIIKTRDAKKRDYYVRLWK